MDLHIAEEFLSVQGEGHYVGTPMYFIRLAGCSVGKPLHELQREYYSGLYNGTLPAYLEECTTHDGRKFLCDTNFKKAYALPAEKLATQIPHVKHVCITGGEPLNQKQALEELISRMRPGLKIHIETSGTVAPDWIFVNKSIWVSVSPKQGAVLSMLHRANEIKFLVDAKFDVEQAERTTQKLRAKIYIQPVNEERRVDSENLDRCMQLLESHPTWNLSVQLHKYLGVR